MKKLLIKLHACSHAREWAADKTIEEIVAECHRGDWLLWLARRVNIGLQPLTLAKGHCANTVRHLMKDERSIKAVDTAIAFGEGKATREELDADRSSATDAAAAHDADAAAYAAADAAHDAYAAAAHATDAAAAHAADAAHDAYAAAAYAAAAHDAYAAAAYAAAAHDAYAAAAYAKKANQQMTADICRKYIGKLIIDKCNELTQKKNDTKRKSKRVS